MKTFKALIGVAICLAVAGIAFATVTFDPTTGIGFVGKGDVQTAFGWNNAQAQANASGVTFTYNSLTNYDVTETWYTLVGSKVNKSANTHTITQMTSVLVTGQVEYDARNHKQIDGFILTGFGGTLLTVGSVPSVGDVTVDREDERLHSGQWFMVTDESTGDGVLWDGIGDPAALLGYVQYPTDTIVTSVTAGSPTGGLYANFAGAGVLLPWPPAPVVTP